MKILVECNADEMVARNLGVSRKQLLHFGGKYELVKKLKERTNDIGIVDEDPGKNQPEDISNYHLINSAERLKLLSRQGSGKQKLIIVCPKLEDWLLGRAKSSDIQPEDYGLPSNPDRLHSIPRYETKEGFKRFLAELIEKDKGMKLLHKWLFENET